MPITLNLAELDNGVRLPYAEQGAADGVPVVLLHGLTDSWRSFEPVLPHLPDSIHAYAVTVRGHGDASRTETYRLDDMVGDITQFLDAVGLDSAIVVGHSMGSIIATRFAIDHPGRVDALVIMGGAASFARVGLEEMRAELAAMSEPVDPDYLRDFQESTIARPVAPGLIDTAVSESQKVSLDTFRQALEDICLIDYSAELGRIGAPTLVVWGDRDAICPRSEQDALLAEIPNARLVVHQGGGHAVHWEDPARCGRQLAQFIEEVTR
jgi:pimeloyl-ACP methyl ester carboxylesterase